MKTVANLCCCMAAVACMTFAACQQHEPVAQLAPFVQPPVPQFDPAFSSFSFDPDQDFTYQHPSGTTIRIPANAFLTADSQAVSGRVVCQYREFQTADDIFLAGIPMHYGNGQLETAGSFELRASQSGQAVQLATDKQLQVRLASQTPGDDYDFFYLDEEARGWDKLGTNQPMLNEEVNRQRRKIRRMQPAMPFPLNRKYIGFSFDALLDVYLGDKIPSADDKTDTKNRMAAYGIGWTDVENRQFVDWKGKKMPAALMVWKMIKRKPFPSWTEGYRAVLTELKGRRYQLDIVSKDSSQAFQTELALVMPLKDLFAFSPKDWKRNYKATMLKIKEEEERLKLMAAVYREFEIDRLGIYNWDKLLKMEESIQLEANFRFPIQLNEKLTEPEVVYITENNRSVIKFPKAVWSAVNLLPNDRGRFFCLLPDQQLVVFSKEQYQQLDFEKIRRMEQPGHVFGMQDGGIIKSPAELKERLGLQPISNL